MLTVAVACHSSVGSSPTPPSPPPPNQPPTTHAHPIQIEFGLGVTEEEIRSPSKSAQATRAALPHPDLHEESLAELRFLRLCMKFTRLCGLPDFGWRDLHAPTSRRFRRQLSGAINFARFREERVPIYDELTEQRQEVARHLTEAKAERRTLAQDLEDAKAATDECFRELEEVGTDVSEIETEIARQNKVQAAIRQESTALKKRANELKDEIATSSLALEEANAEEGQLASRVVSSPARIKKEMNGLLEKLEIERAGAAAAEKEAALVRRKANNVERAERAVAAAASALSEATEAKERCEGAEGEVRDLEASVANLGARTSSLAETAENEARRVQRAEEAIGHVRKQGQTRLDAAGDALSQAQADLVRVEKGRRDGIARVESSEAEGRALEDGIDAERREAENEIADMIEDYRRVEAVALESNLALMRAIDAC